MTAIWAPSGRKARRLARPGQRTAGPAGRQIVDEELAILVDHGDPAAVRAESGRPPDGARVVHGDGAPVDVPDRQGKAGIMRGRQVAAVGAEAEDPDVAIAAGLETGDLLVVGDAADRDRPIAEPEGVAGHGGIEGGRDRRPAAE